MNTTIPACLLRTAADDSAEAVRTCRATETHRNGSWPGTGYFTPCDTALAAIQRREAEAVEAFAMSLGNGGAFALAQQVAITATLACRPECVYTLAQRAVLLDAARSLTRLALEVGGAS